MNYHLAKLDFPILVKINNLWFLSPCWKKNSGLTSSNLLQYIMSWRSGMKLLFLRIKFCRSTGWNPGGAQKYECNFFYTDFLHIFSEGGTGENQSDVTPLNFWIVLIYLAKNL